MKPLGTRIAIALAAALVLSVAPRATAHVETQVKEEPAAVAEPLTRIPPDYPPSALRRAIGGNAVVLVYVDEKGAITRGVVLNEEPGGEGFGAATLRAVKRWTFKAGKPGQYVVEHVFKTETPSRAGEAPPTDPAGQPLANYTAPVYPQVAKAEMLRGDVLLLVTVHRDGHVKKVKILKETPANYGFGKAAAAAVSTWPFPKHAPGDYQVPIHFEPP